ncbi:hypothetical protein P7C70_g6766, partial [Phenoliferia sp. Uapishka_3]
MSIQPPVEDAKLSQAIGMSQVLGRSAPSYPSHQLTDMWPLPSLPATTSYSTETAKPNTSEPHDPTYGLSFIPPPNASLQVVAACRMKHCDLFLQMWRACEENAKKHGMELSKADSEEMKTSRKSLRAIKRLLTQPEVSQDGSFQQILLLVEGEILLSAVAINVLSGPLRLFGPKSTLNSTGAEADSSFFEDSDLNQNLQFAIKHFGDQSLESIIASHEEAGKTSKELKKKLLDSQTDLPSKKIKRLEARRLPCFGTPRSPLASSWTVGALLKRHLPLPSLPALPYLFGQSNPSDFKYQNLIIRQPSPISPPNVVQEYVKRGLISGDLFSNATKELEGKIAEISEEKTYTDDGWELTRYEDCEEGMLLEIIDIATRLRASLDKPDFAWNGSFEQDLIFLESLTAELKGMITILTICQRRGIINVRELLTLDDTAHVELVKLSNEALTAMGDSTVLSVKADAEASLVETMEWHDRVINVQVSRLGKRREQPTKPAFPKDFSTSRNPSCVLVNHANERKVAPAYGIQTCSWLLSSPRFLSLAHSFVATHKNRQTLLLAVLADSVEAAAGWEIF